MDLPSSNGSLFFSRKQLGAFAFREQGLPGGIPNLTPPADTAFAKLALGAAACATQRRAPL